MERFDPLDEAIDEALGDNSRADELAELIAALTARRETFGRELRAAADEETRQHWSTRIEEVDQQIEVLRGEQAISGFVESSVRASATRPRRLVDWEEERE